MKDNQLKIIETNTFANLFDQSPNSISNLIDDSLKLKLKSNEYTISSPPKTPLTTSLSSPNTSSNMKIRSVSPNTFKSKNSLPTKDTVLRKMKKITRSIQELYKATKESKTEL
jgi:hypothetical protein